MKKDGSFNDSPDVKSFQFRFNQTTLIDSYRTIQSDSTAEIKVTRSKFISCAYPLTKDQQPPGLIRQFKKIYYDASHFPYAFRLGIDKNNYKVSDDGEPSGSAGKPLLEAIDKHSLTDILVIVARYFGGTKLGVGGLRRAFFEAADVCLENAAVIEKLIEENINIRFDYKFMSSVMKLIENEKLIMVKNNSGEKCDLEIKVRLSKVERFKEEIIQLTNGTIKF